jgi:protein arginine phosphatase
MHLIFVCTGNTCRSPLAEAAWRRFGAPLLEEKTTASSAGLSASPGAPIATHSAAIAREWGEDISRHRARRVSPEMAREADYFVAMTAQHAQALRQRFNNAKVLQLGEFDNEKNDAALTQLQKLFGEAPGDILDPVGGSLEAYQECAAHIRRAVEGLAQALREGTLKP